MKNKNQNNGTSDADVVTVDHNSPRAKAIRKAATGAKKAQGVLKAAVISALQAGWSMKQIALAASGRVSKNAKAETKKDAADRSQSCRNVLNKMGEDERAELGLPPKKGPGKPSRQPGKEQQEHSEYWQELLVEIHTGVASHIEWKSYCKSLAELYTPKTFNALVKDLSAKGLDETKRWASSHTRGMNETAQKELKSLVVEASAINAANRIEAKADDELAKLKIAA